MYNVIALITSNKILLFLCVIICVMLVIAILRRFIWLFAVAVLAVAAYAGYLAYNGQKIPSTKDEIIEHGRQKLENLKEKTLQELLEKKEKPLRTI